MTDTNGDGMLPAFSQDWPQKVSLWAHVGDVHISSRRRATLDDLRAAAEAAGYVLVSKRALEITGVLAPPQVMP